jgi:hypothetical protein
MQYGYLLLGLFLIFNSLSYADDDECIFPKSSSEIGNLEKFIQELNARNDCDKEVLFLRAEDEVKGLKLSGHMTMKKARRPDYGLMKLFTGKATDEMIDLFSNCGGKEGSHRFMANTLMIEARNACLMPSPPGLLSWDDVEKVAKEFGLRYKGMSLLSLNKYKDIIMKDGMLSLSTTALHKQLVEMIPNGNTRTKFVSELKVIRELQAADGKTIKDFATKKFIPEVPFELAEKLLPIAIKDKFQSQFPKTWDKNKQNSNIKELSKKASEKLAACLGPLKKRIGLGQSFQEATATRNRLEQEFCAKNPEVCKIEGCGKKVNLLSNKTDTTDMQRVQACVLTSMESVIYDFTGDLILSEVSEFKEINFSEDAKSQFVEDGKKELKSCLNDKKINYYTISTENYGTAIEDCAAQIKTKLTRNVASKAIENMNVFSKEEAPGEIQKILEASLDPCLNKLKKVPGASTALCAPVLEIGAGGKVTGNRIAEMTKGMVSDALTSAKSQFDFCVDNIQKEAIANIPKDATSLLDTKMLACSKRMILEASQSIARASFTTTVDGVSKELKDIPYALALENDVIAKVKSCISQGLDEVKSWKGFKAFNETEGFEKLKTECTQKVTAFSASKIAGHEASLELMKMAKNDIIKDEATGNLILSTVASSMNNEPLALPVISIEENIEAAYLQRLKQNPEMKTSEFLDEFKKKMNETGVVKVQENLIVLMEKYGRSKGYSPFEGVNEALSPQCLIELNDRFRKDLKPNPNSNPKETVKLVTELIADGLNYARKKSDKDYSSALTDVKDMCQNLSLYPDLWSFLGDTRFEYLFKARIQRDIIANFNAVVDSTYQENFDKINTTLRGHRRMVLPFAEAQKKQMQDLIKQKFENTAEFEKWLTGTTILGNLKKELPRLVAGDPQLTKDLTNSIIGELFKLKDNDSFASEFTRIQLVANMGIQGYIPALQKLKDKMNALTWAEKKVAANISVESINSLEKHWNPAELEADFNWKGLPQPAKVTLINELYTNAVLPKLVNTPPDMAVIEKSLMDVLNKTTDSTGKSFNTKFQDKITSDVKGNISTGDKAYGFWKSLWD